MAKKNISVTELLPSSKRIQFDIYFLNRFLINYNLESIVAIHQGKTVKEPEQSTFMKIFKTIFISNPFIFIILQILKIIIKDDYFLLLIGDVYRYAEGRSEFYQSNFLAFSIASSGVYLMYSDVHQITWLVNLAHLQGIVPPIQNGMFDIDAVMKLLKRCKTTISICLCIIYLTTFSGFVTFGALSYLNLSLIQYFIYGLFWHIQLGVIHALSCAGWTFLNSGFFHILCYYYKLRIGSVKKRIAIVLEESDPNIQQLKMQMLLKRLNQIIESVATDNKVWNKVNFIFYFFHLNIGTMVNILIFFKPSSVITCLYAYLIFANFTLVSLIAISSAQVNYEFKKVSKKLYGLLICKGTTNELRLKVTIDHRLLTNLILLFIRLKILLII